MSGSSSSDPASDDAGVVVAARLRAAMTARADEMRSLLVRLAEIETPSSDPAAFAPAFALLHERFARLGWRVRRRRGKRTGGALLAYPPPAAGAGRGAPLQLLIGHCDTVWPVGTLASMPVRSHRGRLYGPGVYDMKAGLVQMLAAVETLAELGLEPTVRPVAFVSADEEIGSPESETALRRLARVADRAFVLEPSLGPEGLLKTRRKGVVQYEIHVDGVAAHAGLDPDRGVSAVRELARLVEALSGLDDPASGVRVNVGVIAGGVRPNVIAPWARAEVDVRVPTRADAERVDRAIRALRPLRAEARVRVRGPIGRPPMEPTPLARRLWHRAAAHAAALGFELGEGTAGGGSDGNLTCEYCPTLDGLGAVGDGAHAAHEHVVLARMPERAALLALLLLEPPTASIGQPEE